MSGVDPVVYPMGEGACAPYTNVLSPYPCDLTASNCVALAFPGRMDSNHELRCAMLTGTAIGDHIAATFTHDRQPYRVIPFNYTRMAPGLSPGSYVATPFFRLHRLRHAQVFPPIEETRFQGTRCARVWIDLPL